MIHDKLINPSSIVVVGGSDDLLKPGGKILKNLLDGNFSGDLYVVNPKQDSVQGVRSYRSLDDLPKVDMAIISISYKYCLDVVQTLVASKNTKAFIIISAGFSEAGEEGKTIEKKIASVITQAGGTLIGPNCIGVITPSYQGVFTTPYQSLTAGGAIL